MKKKLLLLCLVFVAIIVHGQTPSIPNGNFEQWTSATCDDVQNYLGSSNSQNFFRYHLPFNVVKSTDAYHGTYAVQLTTNASAKDTSFAYFINTDPNGPPNSWTGGMPYNEKPTGIRGYYKYNVATADSATIIIAFSKAGTNVGTYVFTIGGIHNTYTLFNFNLSPALSVTPDSVVFGALSCKLNGGPNGPTGIPGSILKLDSVSFTGVASQPALMNGDFELWKSQTFSNPNNWYLQNDDGRGTNRTTDVEAGSYAIELKTFPGDHNNHPIAQAGSISTGYYPENCNNCTEQGGYPFSNKIDTLAFWYKYVPSGNDSASVFLNFKKSGVKFFGTGVSLHAAATYQYKEIPFNTVQTPDSVLIQIQSSSWNDTLLSFVGSDLKIDEIHFKSQPLTTGIVNNRNEHTLSVFPNPTTGKIQIQNLGVDVQNLEIYNVLGETVYTTCRLKQQTVNEIDLSGFQKGIYFVKMTAGEKNYTEKIVLQ
jgi:hypothetical protein